MLSWNVLMVDHNHNGDRGAALRLFPEMLEKNSVQFSYSLDPSPGLQ